MNMTLRSYYTIIINLLLPGNTIKSINEVGQRHYTAAQSEYIDKSWLTLDSAKYGKVSITRLVSSPDLPANWPLRIRAAVTVGIPIPESKMWKYTWVDDISHGEAQSCHCALWSSVDEGFWRLGKDIRVIYHYKWWGTSLIASALERCFVLRK